MPGGFAGAHETLFSYFKEWRVTLDARHGLVRVGAGSDRRGRSAIPAEERA